MLSAAVYYLFFTDNKNVFDKSEVNFQVKDTSQVQKIFLTDLQNNNIKLERTSKGWVLNDSLTPREDAIQALLDVLASQNAEQVVPMSYHDNVIKDLSTNNTKVEIYNNKEKTHTFYVGKNPGPNNLTYMLNEGAKRPYIVKLPLQNTFVGIRYFTSLDDWKTRRIFYGNTSIEQIDVQYSDSTQYSYSIQVHGDSVQVKGNYTIEKPLNVKRVTDYLKLYNTLFCLGFEQGLLLKDSIMKHGDVLGTISVKRKDRPVNSIKFYFKPIDNATVKIIQLGNRQYDYDFFLGNDEHQNFMQFSRKTIEKMMRSFPEFYEEDMKQ